MTTDFVMNLTFWIAREFDFVLSLDVTTPVITQAMSIDWISRFWGVGFAMVKSMELGNLFGLLSILRPFGRVYQGWIVWDSVEVLLQREALRKSVLSFSLTTAFQVSLSKSWVLICESRLVDTTCLLFQFFFLVLGC